LRRLEQAAIQATAREMMRRFDQVDLDGEDAEDDEINMATRGRCTATCGAGGKR